MYAKTPMAAAILLLHLCLIFSVLVATSATKPDEIKCIEREGQALLEFKKNLVDKYGHLSSWTSHHDRVTDCCRWDHVHCDNITDHVIGLDLRAPCHESDQFDDYSLPHEVICKSMTGSLSSSLLVLEHLVHLDLSGNDFGGEPIPGFISSLHNLRYLNLSHSKFSGEVPHQLKNLSSLQHLDLSYNYLLSTKDPMAWLSSLSSLRDLSLNNIDLSQATGWANALCNLPSLRYLNLSYSFLPDETPSSLIHTNMSKFLTYIDLYRNFLSDKALFPWLFNFSSSLVEVRLGYNLIKGPVTEAFGKLTSVSHLDLSNNQLQGPIPDSIGKLVSVSHLDLSTNRLQGPIPDSIGKLVSVSYLDLSNNQLQGPIPDSIGKLVYVSYLDLSNNELQGPIPDSIGKLVSVSHLDLSSNQLQGPIPDSIGKLVSVSYLDLSYNQLQGPIPSFFKTAGTLSLSKNKLSGSFPPFLCEVGRNGSVDGDGSSFLDLSYNFISGELPNCWKQGNGLGALVLSNNNFSGKIPGSLGFLQYLRVLHLRNNRFHGHLPSSLRRCSHLEHVDTTNNILSGKIPPWIGNSLPYLEFLILRNNLFSDTIPPQLCKLSSLRIFDLSSNNISGTIPRCLSNLLAMGESGLDINDEVSYSFGITGPPFDFASFIRNGVEAEYNTTLGLVKTIDMSNNKLEGEIPSGISNLTGLISLNLSRNQLEGPLSAKLGQLKSLEFLDLSMNRLSGEIPTSFADMSSLSNLNLSYNNLSGRIPTGTQLQSFDATSFAGNIPGLCGKPLPELCPGDEGPAKDSPGQERDGNDGTHGEEEDWFVSTAGLYISVGVGFATGFWGICGALIFSKTMRYGYFGFLDRIYDRLYMLVKFQGRR